MEKHEKFLEFNGKKIIFLAIDGAYWIALKPICEALKIDYIRSFKNVKNDPILGSVLSKQTIQVSKNGKFQGRKMTCIPEQFIYGWIFSLRSDSTELTDYKKTCYQLLYNHFHGVITNRKELLLEEKEVQDRIAQIQHDLKETDPKLKELEALKGKKRALRKSLSQADLKLIQQTSLSLN